MSAIRARGKVEKQTTEQYNIPPSEAADRPNHIYSLEAGPY